MTLTTIEMVSNHELLNSNDYINQRRIPEITAC